jgi:two-component system phosphate regulon sensor histidine kinase PhoR
VILDADDHILWCNRVAEQHLGLRGERDIGLLVTNLIRLPGFAEFVAHSAAKAQSLHVPASRQARTACCRSRRSASARTASC